MDEWVRIKEIPTSGLSSGELVELLATAMTELAVAQALVLMHGEEHGARRYAMGGRVRFDDEGEPVIRRLSSPQRPSSGG